MVDKKGLSARELLEGVYSAFRKNGREVKLPSKAMAEIANDSDKLRKRIGYTGYELATILEIGEKEWAVTLGTKCGSYPADPYDCDIAAIRLFSDGKFDEELAPEIQAALEKNSYFWHSLIHSMTNGRLVLSERGRFAQRVSEALEPISEEFIVQELEINPNYITMDLGSVVRYKPELVNFLYNAFCKVLAS